ncbi:ComEA family DNA-binding protein [Chitinophaga lutea]
MPKAFFEFSRRERAGIACLLLLTAGVHSIPYIMARRMQPAPEDTAGYAAAVAQIDAMMAADSGLHRRNYPRDSGYRGRFRSYDPSGRYVSYNGRRYPRDSARWKYPRDSGYRWRSNYPKRALTTSIDVNAADSAQWEALPGIGPALARRIVLFRERLGGFYSTAQVGETYGLADSVFNKIQGMLSLGADSLRKIDLNRTDEKSLADHPYISMKQARLIIRYRNARGPFRDVRAVRDAALVDDSIYRKLEKYLVVY